MQEDDDESEFSVVTLLSLSLPTALVRKLCEGKPFLLTVSADDLQPALASSAVEITLFEQAMKPSKEAVRKLPPMAAPSLEEYSRHLALCALGYVQRSCQTATDGLDCYQMSPMDAKHMVLQTKTIHAFKKMNASWCHLAEAEEPGG